MYRRGPELISGTMENEIERLRTETIDLYAENLALTAVVTSVFRRLALNPAHTIGAMKIVESLSKIILSEKK